ncbi:MAG: purine-binding chemotaxis protein CheW [Proteobacteria bacterium]|nr:purine-binding chemotaxis protein CheW [Pseudomonadota bacterium]
MTEGPVIDKNQFFKVIHFNLGYLDFAIKLTRVIEVVTMQKIRKIPGAPEFVEGVINLRGDITVVVDLRKLFLIGGTLETQPKILVFSLNDKGIGFIVDNVSQILRKNQEDILDPPPVVIKGLEQDCIYGVFEEKGKNVLLIDLTKSLSALEAEGLDQVLKQELTYLVDRIKEQN